VLRRRGDRLVGIPNGIDTSVWDPGNDRFLPEPYSVERLDAKTTAKRALLARYGLPADGEAVARPLVGMISRMVDQKGFDLIASIAGELPGLDATFVVLGTGESRYQDLWQELAARHPSRVAAYIGFEESLAHLIEGGADIFLMPSRFEPSGLNQMYSLRYGTVPVVRAVGGLADTVDDYTPGNPRSTGFVFREYTGAALLAALRRALDLFRDRPAWRALQTAGMRCDNSWDHSAGEYVRIYGLAMGK
jgi:starch synthase